MLRIDAGPLGIYSLVAVLAKHVQSPVLDPLQKQAHATQINAPSLPSSSPVTL